MKKFIVLIMSTLLLVSCTVQPSAKMGSLTLSVDSSSRGAGGTDSSTTIRYSLKRNGTVIPLNNRPSVEATLSGATTITIDDLLPGKGYQLTLSIGTKNDQYLAVACYGISSAFGISEGTNTAVDMTLLKGPVYVPLATSGGVSSAAVVGSDLYVLDGTVLKSYPIADGLVGTPVTTPAGVTINSLTVGKYFNDASRVANELWLNTSRGIYRYPPLTETGFNMNPDLTPNVSFSRAVALNVTTGPIIGLYSGGGSNLGMVIADAQDDFKTEWKTLEAMQKENVDVQKFLSTITRDVITSVCGNEDTEGYPFYYVSSGVGTIIGSEGLKTIVDDPTFNADTSLEKLSRYMLKISDEISIKVVSSAGNRVFAGTDSGLYTDTVNTNTANNNILGKPVTGLSLIPGTEGKQIVSLESYNNGGTVITAAVTADNLVLIIKDGIFNDTLEAATGIPENAKAVFYKTTSSLHVILSGLNGAIDYEIILK